MTIRLRSIEPVQFPWFDHSRYSFSLGLSHPHGVWLSGHSASQFDSESGHIVVRGGMREQARTAYAKIAILLEAAEIGWEHVTHLVENVTISGLDDYEEAAEVRGDVLGGVTPVVSTVVVRQLLRPMALIEIEVTASGSMPDDGGFSGFVYLPTLLPIDEHGETVAPDDLLGQVTFVFERAAKLLEHVGLGMDHVVKTLDFSTPATLASYAQTGNVRRAMLGPVYPAGAGILMPRLQRPEALFALEVTASSHEPQAVNPGWERYRRFTYSPAVRAGKLLFCSGQAALNPENATSLFKGDVAAQAEYEYENVLTLLAAAGATPEQLVRTVEYVCPEGLERYREVGRVRERVLARPLPRLDWPRLRGAIPARVPYRSRRDGGAGMTAVSLLTDEVRSFLHRKVSYVAPEALGRAAFRYFATAVGDDNPVYTDDDAARAAGFREVVAPPTLVCETNQYLAGKPDAEGYMGHRWELPVENCRLLRGGNEYELFQPVYPEDVLHVEWEIVEITERRSSSGKSMLLARSVATYSNQFAELLARNIELLIFQSLEEEAN